MVSGLESFSKCIERPLGLILNQSGPVYSVSSLCSSRSIFRCPSAENLFCRRRQNPGPSLVSIMHTHSFALPAMGKNLLQFPVYTPLELYCVWGK